MVNMDKLPLSKVFSGKGGVASAGRGKSSDKGAAYSAAYDRMYMFGIKSASIEGTENLASGSTYVPENAYVRKIMNESDKIFTAINARGNSGR